MVKHVLIVAQQTQIALLVEVTVMIVVTDGCGLRLLQLTQVRRKRL